MTMKYTDIQQPCLMLPLQSESQGPKTSMPACMLTLGYASRRSSRLLYTGDRLDLAGHVYAIFYTSGPSSPSGKVGSRRARIVNSHASSV